MKKYRKNEYIKYINLVLNFKKMNDKIIHIFGGNGKYGKK